jgi:hypothetical protein
MGVTGPNEMKDGVEIEGDERSVLGGG